MKNIVSFLLIVLFYNCSPKLNKTQEENLIFRNGIEWIRLDVLRENKSITVGNPIRLKVLTENIKVENLRFSAPNLQFVKSESKLDNEIILEISAKKENIISRKFALNISYKSDGKMIFHKFLIPVNEN